MCLILKFLRAKKHGKICWNTLEKYAENGLEERENYRNQGKSRDKPDFFDAGFGKSATLHANCDNGFIDSSRLYRLSRPKNSGVEILM
ncbi:MAG: hypothetical protein NMNS01_15690 [Nitrosomonas sp.]|nr:MAG: hypothetical protein NMNS01_15690 [Nitrosomonas sp.]